MLIICAVDYVLILRSERRIPSSVSHAHLIDNPNLVVFALYPGNRFVQSLIGALYLIEVVAMFVGILGLPKLGYDSLCTMTRISKFLFVGM